MTTAYKAVDPATFNRNTEAARSRRTGGGAGWKIQVGKPGQPARNVIRILPPHTNMPDVFIETKVHFSLGPNDDTAARCLAPWAEECPGCIHVDQILRQARVETDPEAAKILKKKASDKAAQLRFGANIIDEAHPEAGVQQYFFGPGVEKDLRGCFYDDDQNFRDISHPQTGRSVILLVDKNAQGFNQYQVRPKENAEPLRDLAWLNEIKDLTEFTKKPTVQEIQDALLGKKRTDGASAKTQTQATPKPSTPNAAADVKPLPTIGKPLTPPATVVKKAAATDDPFAAARAVAAQAGFASPIEITGEQVQATPHPDCYAPKLIAAGNALYKDAQIADPKDAMCQKCKLFLPCLAAKLAA